jgi:hypothetical protein
MPGHVKNWNTAPFPQDSTPHPPTGPGTTRETTTATYLKALLRHTTITTIEALRYIQHTPQHPTRHGGSPGLAAAIENISLPGYPRALTPNAGPKIWLTGADIGLAITLASPGAVLTAYVKATNLTHVLAGKPIPFISRACEDRARCPFVIPIHTTNHWQMIAVHPQERSAYAYCSLNNSAQLTTTLRQGLGSTWTCTDMRNHVQTNDYDCGVHAINFALAFRHQTASEDPHPHHQAYTTEHEAGDTNPRATMKAITHALRTLCAKETRQHYTRELNKHIPIEATPHAGILSVPKGTPTRTPRTPPMVSRPETTQRTTPRTPAALQPLKRMPRRHRPPH